MNILGIDLSLNGTGLAILSDDELFHEPHISKQFPRSEYANVSVEPMEWYFGYLLSPMPTLNLQRWDVILDAILACAETCHQVVIEGYSFASNMAYARAGAELGGIVRYHLAKRHNQIPLEVPPSTLKKFLTGKGGADKNQVLKEIYKRYHVDLPDDNMADAFGLAKFGQAMVSTEGLPQYQVEIIESFKKPKEKPAKRGRVA